MFRVSVRVQGLVFRISFTSYSLLVRVTVYCLLFRVLVRFMVRVRIRV